MEHILGILFVIYLIYTLVSALTQKQGRPNLEEPGDDAPWPHLENVEDPASGGAPAAGPEPVAEPSGVPGWPTRPGHEGAGPFWPDLFGDPRRIGSPWGWPTELPPDTPNTDASRDEMPKVEAKKVLARVPELTQVSVRSELKPVSKAAEAAEPGYARPSLDLNAASLRQAILYTEVLGPPRSVRPHRPPRWQP